MIKNYQPDFENLRRALKREGGPAKKMPFWELFHDVQVMEHFLGEKMADRDALVGAMNGDKDLMNTIIDQRIRVHLMLGYDYVPIPPLVPLTFTNRKSTENTAEMAKGGERQWADESSSTIANWEDFENYKWPTLAECNFRFIEEASKRVPEGMKIAVGTSGILENVQWLMGYEQMAYSIYDEPELIDALFDKIGPLFSSVYETAAQIDNVGLMAMGDDMGFNGGTLFSPDFLRKYVFPWQKKCVESAHKHGHPFVLHTCGQVDAIMDDLIDYVGIDAKHSFEDIITPVEQVHAKYHERVTLVGGVDIDLLARGTQEQVRARTRQILEACAHKGSYVMGTGNSVANYVNMDNYIAMMDETRKFVL